MYIFIMRHGEAEPYNNNDKQRHLTKFGKMQAESAAKWMNDQLELLSVTPPMLDGAYVSPYVRTQETYNAVKTRMSIASIQTLDMITPMGDADEVHDYIDAFLQLHPDMSSLLVITHMPLVSLLSDVMCKGFNAKIFNTADVLMIDYDPISSKGKQLSFYQSLT